jgi:hypothetical protein
VVVWLERLRVRTAPHQHRRLVVLLAGASSSAVIDHVMVIVFELTGRRMRSGSGRTTR